MHAMLVRLVKLPKLRNAPITCGDFRATDLIVHTVTFDFQVPIRLQDLGIMASPQAN